MGRLSEGVAIINMNSSDRKKYVYGINKDIYFSNLHIDDEFLKRHKPPKEQHIK